MPIDTAVGSQVLNSMAGLNASGSLAAKPELLKGDVILRRRFGIGVGV